MQRLQARDTWSTADADWRPWFQTKPAFRVRVIDPSGAVEDLGSERTADASEGRGIPGTDSDDRRVKVSLPRMAVGTVVEHEYITVDRDALVASIDNTATAW